MEKNTCLLKVTFPVGLYRGRMTLWQVEQLPKSSIIPGNAHTWINSPRGQSTNHYAIVSSTS